MQLKKLSPIAAGLLLASLLSACGGGGGDDPAPAASAPAAPAIKVSAVSLNPATPTPIAQATLQFNGGGCSDGTGTLTATWDFGDGTVIPVINGSPNPTHSYDETATGAKTVKVTCTDTAGTTAKKYELNLTVLSAAMNGFLGKTWFPYSAIDTTNVSPYPVAGIADNTAGDVYGVWLRRVSGNMEVTSGTTNFSSSIWTPSADDLTTGTDRSAFDDTLKGGRTATIDLAVSPDGHAMAAWMAGTSIWYSTRSSLITPWSAPLQLSNTVGTVLDETIKVVVNDAGNGAIAYCTSAGARVIAHSSATPATSATSEPISKDCSSVETSAFSDADQRYRSFDIAIDNSSTIYAVGVNDAPGGKFVVSLKSRPQPGVWTPTATDISSNQLTTKPTSLSYSRSPNGNYEIIAWDQVVKTVAPIKHNVFTSIRVAPSTAWGLATAVQDDYITKDYSHPLIAINDSGFAFLAMKLIDLSDVARTEVSNYNAAVTPATWSSPFQVGTTGFKTTDIAIDNWGTGLITRSDDYYSQAGTFSKAGVWSTFKNISPRYPSNLGSTLHSQTMRALPDGRAILVTSVYDDITATTATTKPVASGYMLLK